MQFVYGAFAGSDGSPVKGKVSRWRHLQSMTVHLLLIGLVFFLIMQNGDLRRQIRSKLSHEFVQDIFNEKVAQLSKEMEVVKLIVVEANRKSGLQAEEIKAIIRRLTKEIGLPLPQYLREMVGMEEEEVREEENQNGLEFVEYSYRNTIQLRQDYGEQEADSEQVVENDIEQTDSQGFGLEEQSVYQSGQVEQASQNEQGQQIEQGYEDEQIQQQVGQDKNQECTFYEYLLEGSLAGEGDYEREEEEMHQNDPDQLNLSHFIISSGSSAVISEYVGQVKDIFIFIGNLGLIILLTIGLLMLVFLMANRCRKPKSRLFQALLKASDQKRAGEQRKVVQKAQRSVSKL